jgi:uncharacterized damage-inducible protein DinB
MPRLNKARATPDASSDSNQVLLETYAVNERMNQIVLDHLAPAAWRASLPGSKGRTIAAIVVHVHNIRRKWLRLSAPHLKLPAPLNRTSCTQKQAQAALLASAARCSEMLAEALAKTQSGKQSGRQRKMETFLRDGWAKPWPAGAAMVAYMISHDAHHRGQICMLAHQLGYPLSMNVTSKMWSWERLWKDCGFTHPR